MSKSKVFIILVILLLMTQMFSSNLGPLAVSGKTNSDTDAKVDVKSIDHNTDTIKWLVTIETSGDSEQEAETKIAFSEGQTHDAIKQAKEVKVEKSNKGYTVTTPAGDNTYNLEISTKITDDSKQTFALAAKTEYAGKSDEAMTQVEIEAPENQEQETAEENEAPAQDGNKELETQNESPSNNEETTRQEMKKEEEKDEEIEVEEFTYEKVLAILKSKPLDEFTEEELKKLIAGLTEEELERLAKELEFYQELGVVDPSFKPFVANKSRNMLRTMTSDPDWPNAGSVKLNGKTATETNNYGEWEIELSVEAKDVDTSKTTNIVLLLDRSGSMQGNRLTRAKEAAIQFVNEILTEGSQAKIAVVSFSDSATQDSDFRGPGERQQLINAIDGISASGGTNIQAGLRMANNLVAPTSAQEKIIVLLSDGEPTYSYKGTSAVSHNWTVPSTPYNFRITNFSDTRVGSGSDYNLRSSYFCGWIIFPIIPRLCNEQYTVNGFNVTTNGPATISEAWRIMNNNINMYSIGLHVGNTARIVLENSQNKGYYQAGVDDLSGIFDEIAGEIKYAATNAVVTDPLGEMFKLVRGKYDGNDYYASQGTVTFDESSKTFTWNIGEIKEGEKPTLKYTVTIDWEHPDLKGHVDYPMNEKTPLNYRDFNGNNVTKYFEIPKGQIGKGKIKRIGYRVNVDGDPVDADGNVVGSIKDAHKFYEEYYGDLHDFGKHLVPALEVDDYTLLIGEDPQEVTISPNEPVKVAYFGYVKTSEMKAGEVTVKYVEEDGNELATSKVLNGNIGDSYDESPIDIDGYEFLKLHDDSAPASGTFTHEAQTVIFVYKQLKGKIKLIKVDADDETKRLQGATFELRDSEDNLIGEATTDNLGKASFLDLPVGKYYLIETKAPEGYSRITKPIEVEISKGSKVVTRTIENSKQGWDIPATGGIGTLGFYMTGILLMISAAWFVIRRRIVS